MLAKVEQREDKHPQPHHREQSAAKVLYDIDCGPSPAVSLGRVVSLIERRALPEVDKVVCNGVQSHGPGHESAGLDWLSFSSKEEEDEGQDIEDEDEGTKDKVVNVLCREALCLGAARGHGGCRCAWESAIKWTSLPWWVCQDHCHSGSKCLDLRDKKRNRR